MPINIRNERLYYPPDMDVAVFQRPTNIILAESVHMLRSKGIAVIIDMDDDLGHIHPSNPAWAALHPRTNPINNWLHAQRACRDASMVTVSTPRLASVYGGHGRVRVLPNYVPERFLSVPHADNRSVGWAGSLHSHPDDLSDVSGAMERLYREGADLKVIGDGIGVGKAWRVGKLTPTGIVPFDEWIPNVAKLGIGIAPLAMTRFNEIKSWLKPLEYSAAGVPWVASPTSEYKRFASFGAGLIAEKPKDWYRLLCRLVHDDAYRWEQSQAVREVAKAMTYEQHAWQWAECWQDALTWERSTANV